MHLCCVIVARKRLVDDVDVGDDDMAMEVQTINLIRHKILAPYDIRDSLSLLNPLLIVMTHTQPPWFVFFIRSFYTCSLIFPVLVADY